MALVNVVNMTVLDNPTSFYNPFQFEITFECLSELDDDLEWRVLYVSNANDSQQDQILDEILVGPIPVGYNKFVLQADPPNIQHLLASTPKVEDILGVTVVLVTCSYKEREFVRIGYYVNNEYEYETITMNSDTAATTTTTTDENDVTTTTSSSNMDIVEGQNQEQQPIQPQQQQQIILPSSIYDIDFHKVTRHILADKPRVTKFPIPWNNTNTNTTSTSTNHHPTKEQQQQDISMMKNDNNNTTTSMGNGTPSTVDTTNSNENDDDRDHPNQPSMMMTD